MSRGVHLTHCNFGEEFGHCKYGDADCPAMLPGSEASKLAATLKGRWQREVAMGATESGFHHWVEYECVDTGWGEMLKRIYAELDAEES